MQFRAINTLGKSDILFNQPMMVPDNWQAMTFGDSLRFILTAPDGSEVLGDYITGPNDPKTRNLQGYTRYCLESVTCLAAQKSFTWYVTDWQEAELGVQLNFDNMDVISATGGDQDSLAMELLDGSLFVA